MRGWVVRVGAPVAVVAVLGAGAVMGCSSDGGSASASSTTSAPSSTVGGPGTSSTTAPVDYRSAMVSRLSDEWGDPAVAEQVVAALGADGLAAWEAKVPLGQVATTPLLDYRPAATAPERLDAVAVFSFGNRVADDGSVSAGPTNQALADVTAALVAEHPMPVYAQWEVARLLIDAGVPNVNSVEPVTDADGKVTYLSTRGVADVIASAGEGSLGRVGVVCFADHEGRCVLTATAAGLDATAVEGVELPSTYDPDSGQAWTRDRVAYLTTDLAGRLAS